MAQPTPITDTQATAERLITEPDLSKAQLDQLRQALGLGSEVTDSALRETLSTPSGRALLQTVVTQPTGQGPGGLSGFLEAIPGAAKRTAHDISSGNPIVHALFKGLYQGQDAPKKKADPAKNQGGASQTDALQQLAQYLTQGYVQQGEVAMGQMGQQLAQQNQAVTSTVDQFLTGTSSGNAAVDAAQAAYAKAYSAGEGLQSAAYAHMGTANAQYEAASPLQPVLSILTSGLGSGQYKQLPSSLVQNLPPEVQYALQQAGVGVTNPGSTGTSGQPIPTPKGGWPASITKGQKTTAPNTLSSLLAGALAPSSTNPVGNPTQYGNPNVPGQ